MSNRKLQKICRKLQEVAYEMARSRSHMPIPRLRTYLLAIQEVLVRKRESRKITEAYDPTYDPDPKDIKALSKMEFLLNTIKRLNRMINKQEVDKKKLVNVQKAVKTMQKLNESRGIRIGDESKDEYSIRKNLAEADALLHMLVHPKSQIKEWY